jgi:hypothetical protein
MRDPPHQCARVESSLSSRGSPDPAQGRALAVPSRSAVSVADPLALHSTRGGRGTDLPHRVYERLPAEFGDSFVTSTLLEERHSSDGTTTKLLFEMQDGLRVEVSAYQSPYGPYACVQ